MRREHKVDCTRDLESSAGEADMDDDGYVRALLGILTNPEPAGVDPADPYGTAEDGIDRYDGFSREVVVTSLGVRDGEHGAELVVAYAWRPDLEVAGPKHGVAHLPFDRQWRELNGYDAPSAYAPVVANEVMRAARNQAVRHSEGDGWHERRARARASLPTRAEQWRILRDALGREGRVTEVGPGRFEVHLLDEEGSVTDGDVVTVVVTPEQWEELLVTRVGDDADLYVEELLGPRDDDERFVVCFNGDLVRSTRETLPPVRGRALERRFAELRAGGPRGKEGWFAYRPLRPGEEDPAGPPDG